MADSGGDFFVDVRQLKAFKEKGMVTSICLKPWSESPDDGWVIESILISGEAVLVKKIRSESTKIFKSVDGAYGDLMTIGCDEIVWKLC